MFIYKEGETPLDDLSGLKIKIPNITRAQLDEGEADNIRKALLIYYPRKRGIIFDVSFFQKLHKTMFGDVWKWAGEFRIAQTNIGSPPIRIREDLQVLQKDLEYFPADIEGAAMLHHRAVQIHPYNGGNGRWSRLLSDLWLREKAQIVISWPEGLARESDIRGEYLKALKSADGLDYGPLLAIYERLSKAR